MPRQSRVLIRDVGAAGALASGQEGALLSGPDRRRRPAPGANLAAASSLGLEAQLIRKGEIRANISSRLLTFSLA